MRDIFDEIKLSDGQGDIFDQIGTEQKPNQESKRIRSTSQDVALQTGLGLVKRLSYPLDILKGIASGIGERTLSELAEDDPNLNLTEAKKAFNEVAKNFPTQEAAEKFIENQTGIDLSPQSTLGQIARSAGEFRGFTPGKLLEGGLKAEGKKALSAGTGAVTKEAAKVVGAPEIVADVAGLVVGSVPSATSLGKKELGKEAKELEQIAEKHALPKYAGLEKEKPPKITPIVSKEREIGLKEEFSKKSREAINKVIDQSLPIRKLKEEGIDLKELYTKAYSDARHIAARNHNKEINIKPVLDYIDKEISRIQKVAPSPGPGNKAALKLLQEEKEALQNAKFTPEVLINQHIENNAKRKGIYKKPEFTGAEEEILEQISAMNEKLIESAEKSGLPAMANKFKEANKLYSETAKVNRAENIFERAFEDGYDPKSLVKVLKEGTRKRAYLERDLGKGAVKDLEDIAKYGQKAEEKVFKQLKTPQSLQEWLSKMTVGKASLNALLALTPVKYAQLPFKLGKGLAQRIQGQVFTRESTRKPYVEWMRALSTANKALISKATQNLSKAIDQEFGSEQDLFDLISEES